MLNCFQTSSKDISWNQVWVFNEVGCGAGASVEFLNFMLSEQAELLLCERDGVSRSFVKIHGP